MCGIAGIVDLSSATPDRDAATRIRDNLTHRGPDDLGLYVDDDAALGSRRLSIIDCSAAGRMPLPNRDETLWVTFNGEIYNFRALREELRAAGYPFRSNADSEIVVHAYEHWGDRCVDHLVGMFAFAIWDRRKRRLFGARDRLGVKPFFYWQHGSQLVFASEVHALYGEVPIQIDDIEPLALDYYLAFGSVPPDRGIVRGIEKLPPGHTLSFDASGSRVERYWEIHFRPTEPLGPDDALEALDERLNTAVARRLESDVPLGCFLSGGIDSGLVTALAARHTSGPLSTFSVGFGGSGEADERPLARQVAERYGTRHQEIEVGPPPRDLLTRALWHVGEPFADASILPTYQISAQARQLVTVALSGDGGDESFAGYPNVRAAWNGARVRGLVPGPLRSLARAAAGAPGIASTRGAARLARFLDQYVEADAVSQFDQSDQWSRAWREALRGPRLREAIGSRDALDVVAAVHERTPPLSPPEMHLFTDLQLRLGGRYLTKVDIASSMVSLEIRSPFLDHELVEFAAHLPFSTKLLGGRQKGLLRRLAERYLPRDVVRGPKRGFAPGIDSWVRDEWSPVVDDFAANSRVVEAGLLRGDVLARVAREHREMRSGHGARLWTFVCLEAWWRLFVDRSLRPGDVL